MSLLSRSPKPSTRPPELRLPRSMWWWALPAALLVGAAVWGVSAWLLQDVGGLDIDKQVSTRIEAVRTALAAGAGVGAAVTLLLAVRRQQHQELAAAHTTHDAAERRVTELYGKAAEQLGSDQAPVRLAGLYALRRLGEHTPALQQTIVDVICAYLRMPYTPPLAPDAAEKPAVPRAALGGVTAPTGRDPHEERQVRLTAQRILAAHLHYQDTPARRWWRPLRADPNDRHWPDIRLNLTGATLLDFDLRICRVRTADFGDATFTGDARFDGATFTGDARFDGATFSGDARFDGATFSGDARFVKATCSGRARLDGATFTGDARFGEATFSGDARFDGATFSGDAGFDKATFSGDARFGGATFSGDAGFGEVTFSGTAGFGEATFSGTAWFVEVTFSGDAGFVKATFSGRARFGEATFSGDARFDGVTFSGRARFGEATFSGDARFDGATFTGDARFDKATFSDAAAFDKATFSDAAAFDKATFSGRARFGEATFSGAARFVEATGLERAELGHVRVAPAAAGVVRVWPPCWREEPGVDGWQTLRLVEPEPDSGEEGGAAEPGAAGEAGG
ncbi:pentapeptide repeat-containing protein [Nonomuraea dietziae]|uniref:pentapeptide repeat-containing protein n=1 Tax=Nonomuraea dietziae TaxID=65515 RepID=UPI0033F94D0B